MAQPPSGSDGPPPEPTEPTIAYGQTPPWPTQPPLPIPMYPSASPGWPGTPWMVPPPRFDPADPLVSEDYSGWWRRSLAVIKAGWQALALLQLLIAVPILAVLIPTNILVEAQQRRVDRELAALPAGQMPDLGAVLTPTLTSLPGALITGVIYSLGTLAAIHMVAIIATNGRPRMTDALRSAVRRMPAMVGWGTLAVLISIVALLLCFLPVIYVGAVFILLPAVVAFERGGAIPRCFRLFHVDLGAAVARIATIVALSVAIGLVLAAPLLVVKLVIIGPNVVDPTADVSASSIVVVGTVGALLSSLSYFLVGLIVTPMMVALYADLRARSEPFTSASLPHEFTSASLPHESSGART